MKTNEIVDRYYDAFAKADFSEVPMLADIRFDSPMMQLDSADSFRAALGNLAKSFKGMKMRCQNVEGSRAVSVYDFDMGLPGGPIPMAEVLSISGGEISHVELIFDSKRLG